MSEIKLVNVNNLKNDLDKVNDGEICLVLDQHTKISTQNLQLATRPFCDDKISFVYCDIIVCEKDIKHREYFDGSSIPNVPFFMRKPKNYQLPTNMQNMYLEMMVSLINQNLFFEHIADPLITIEL